MFRVMLAIVRKDLTLLGLRGGAFIQAILLGLILIFVFSLAKEVGQTISAQHAASVFWLSSLFGQILLFNQLYALEEVQGQRLALLTMDVPCQTIYLAKALAAFLLLCLAQAIFWPAGLIFLGQELPQNLLGSFLGIISVDLGICALGSILGALSRGQAVRESLLTILLFPLLMPQLLAAISLHTQTQTGDWLASSHWFYLTFAYDAIFLSAGLLLFPFIYTGDEE